MYFIKIKSQEFGPYQATLNSQNQKQGDIAPIFYDTAVIELFDEKKRYSIGYKISKNLLGDSLTSLDIIDEDTGEVFSFQVNNIFFLKVVNGDPVVVALVGNDLKLYKNYGKQQLSIESDGDKKQTVPLGAFDMFVSYDDKFYYPVLLGSQEKSGQISKFYDYYGFKSYTDNLGKNHFIMLIEGEDSNEFKDAWYFVDNFEKISKRIDFGDDSQYIENWEIDEYGDIYMTITNGQVWFLDTITGGVTQTKRPKTTQFTFTRYFEDTDHEYIVGKNQKGLFIIDRNKTNITLAEQEKIIYYKDVYGRVIDGKNIYFLMEDMHGDINLVNVKGRILSHTDLSQTDRVENISIMNHKILEVTLSTKEKRKYIID